MVESGPLSDPQPAAEDIKAVTGRHPGRWLTPTLGLLVAVSIAHSMATNKRFGWQDVAHFLFDPRITAGVVATIELPLAAQALGVVLGILLAVMRLSPNPLISIGSWLYVWFFRGTPVIVQLTFWYVCIEIGRASRRASV